MKLRVVASLTAFLSFATLATTGLVLFVVPQGRVAYWSGWALLGLSKEQWAGVHTLLGLLFVVAGIVHVVLNWKPLVSYLKDRVRARVRLLTPESALALVLTVAFAAGAVLRVPPLSWVLDLGEAAKERAARTYGEPPYGHAEQSSLATFASRADLDLAKARQLLEKAGMKVEGNDQRLQDVARANGVTPQQLYAAMKGAERPKAATAGMPEEAAPGLGRKTLESLCAEYGLDGPSIRKALFGRGIDAAEGATIKAIAEKAGMGPHDLYALIREVSRGR